MVHLRNSSGRSEKQPGIRLALPVCQKEACCIRLRSGDLLELTTQWLRPGLRLMAANNVRSTEGALAERHKEGGDEMKQRGRMVLVNGNGFVPKPERVLVTTVCRDVYADRPDRERPSSIGPDGFQDGFGEYSTHLPETYKFFTQQPSYGVSFLGANVQGPTYLHYPNSTEIESHLATGRYDVIAISAYTWSLPWAMDLAKRAKEQFGVREAWLGCYAVMTDEQEMRKVFDRLFWGYSESTFNSAIGQSEIPVEDIVHPDLTTHAYFLGRRSVVGHMLFRRGCPNRCTYCADPVFSPGGEPNLSIDCVDAILDYYEDRGINSVYFSNQDTAMHTSFGQAVLESLHRRDMRFGMLTSFASLGADGADGIKRLHDNGLIFVLLGLESLNDSNLIKTHRKSRFKNMYETLKLLQQLKVMVTTTYMICFEDDTPVLIREAKKMMVNELGVSVCLFNITMPLPGTPMYWDYKKKGLIWDWDWTHWTGNYLVWKHPTISPGEAKELLGEMRGDVNNPEYNPNVADLWRARCEKEVPYDAGRSVLWQDKGDLGRQEQSFPLL